MQRRRHRLAARGRDADAGDGLGATVGGVRRTRSPEQRPSPPRPGGGRPECRPARPCRSRSPSCPRAAARGRASRSAPRRCCRRPRAALSAGSVSARARRRRCHRAPRAPAYCRSRSALLAVFAAVGVALSPPWPASAPATTAATTASAPRISSGPAPRGRTRALPGARRAAAERRAPAPPAAGRPARRGSGGATLRRADARHVGRRRGTGVGAASRSAGADRARQERVTGGRDHRRAGREALLGRLGHRLGDDRVDRGGQVGAGGGDGWAARPAGAPTSRRSPRRAGRAGGRSGTRRARRPARTGRRARRAWRPRSARGRCSRSSRRRCRSP